MKALFVVSGVSNDREFQDRVEYVHHYTHGLRQLVKSGTLDRIIVKRAETPHITEMVFDGKGELLYERK